jgi:exodeoxyribonuclease VII small subunit
MQNSEENINFETKIEQASKLLEQLSDPNITLQSSVKIYKDGLKELEVAQKLLDEAKLEYQEITSLN